MIRSSSRRAKSNRIRGFCVGSATLIFAISLLLITPSIGWALPTQTIDATGGNCAAIGTWDPGTLTCTLTTDIVTDADSDGIVITADNVKIDGNGHALTGAYTGTNTPGGVFAERLNGVEIRNLSITGFYYGIHLKQGGTATITGNVLSGMDTGVYLKSANNNTITGNAISNNSSYGMHYSGANNNTAYQNNFINNPTQVRISGGGSGNIFNQPLPTGGNYWSDWNTPDSDGDGFVDNPYSFFAGTDNYPYTAPSAWDDVTSPTVSNVQPTGTIYSSSTTVSADYSDPGNFASGIDAATVTVSLDGTAMTGCTVTATSVSCPASGLGYGTHTIIGSVADNVGNTASISGSFFVGDNIAPTISNIQPQGDIYGTDQTVTADFADAALGSGIDSASAAVTVDGAALTGCTATASGVSCPASGLVYGTHNINVSVSDVAGNPTSANGSFFVLDSTGPVVSGVSPTGTIYTSGTDVTASYSDDFSGIDTASVSVTLNGSTLTGCTVTATGVTCPVTGLAYGSYTIGGSVSDTAGNSSPISGSFNVGDADAPLVSNVQPSGAILTGAPTVSADFSDPGATPSGIDTASVTVMVDGSTLTGCTVSATGVSCAATGLGYGNHAISGSVSDNAGNTSPISGSFFVDDDTAPVVSNVSPSGTIFNSSPAISADFSDPGATASGINTASVTVLVDGTTLTGCTVTAAGVSCPSSGLGYGNHTISGSVSDNAGNTSPISGTFFVDDADAPLVTNVQPSGAILTGAPTVSADFSDPGATASGIDTASVTVLVDGTTLTGCTVTAAGVSCPSSGLGYGNHTISGSVSDNAGNTSPISGTFNVDDAVAPVVSNVSPSGTIFSSSPAISADYSDPGSTASGIDTASVTVLLDSVAMPSCTVTATGVSCPTSGLSYGTHTITGSVSDMAGNSTPISGSFFVGDNSGPSVSGVGPSGTIDTTSTDVVASYTDSGSGIDTAAVTVALDGTTLTGCTVTASGVSCPVSGLAYGAHTISGSVSDIAGNSSPINGSFFVGDNNPPAVTDVSPAGDIYVTDTTVSASYGDNRSGIDTASVTVSLDGSALSGCTVTASGVSCPVTGLSYGAHDITGSVSDNAGNSSPINGSFFVGDNTAPVVESVTPSGTIFNSSPTVAASYSDSFSGIDTASVSVSLDGSPLGGCTVTASGISCPTSGLSYGTHNITGSVSDVAGNASAISGSFFVGDNTGPSVSGVGPSGTIYTSSADVTASYSDGGSGIDVASVTVALNGTTLTGCTATGVSVSCPVSDLAYGAYTISGSVSDVAGNSSPISGSFDVGDNVGPSVSDVAPAGNIFTSDTTLSASYSDALSGIDTASVTVSLDGSVLSGCTVTASGISCPVTGLAYGAHTITGSVSDNAGNSSTIDGSFFVGDNTAPVVGSVTPSGTIFTSSPTVAASYSDSFSGIDTASVTVSLDGSPLSGCTVTASGVSCPTSGLTYGTHNITGSVSDVAGNASAISGSFFVGDVFGPEVSGVGPSGTIYTTSTDVVASYSDSGSGINVASVTVALDGVTLSGCTVTASGLSCPVSGLSYGSHTISGSVSDNAGNASPISGSFDLGDNTGPAVSNVSPSGDIPTGDTTLSASYSDDRSGINTASVTVMLDGIVRSGCTVTASGVSCPVTGLSYGTHGITGSVSDNAGNSSAIAGSFFVGDSTAPAVGPVTPSGMIFTSNPVIEASYSDGDSGIDAASVTLSLDGSPMSGCTVTETGVTCPANALAYGTHNITGSVSDNSGNSSPISGSFFVGDNVDPQVSGVGPSGTIFTTTTDIVASYSDDNSGIDTASVNVALDGTTLLGCTVTGASVNCPVTGLAYGTHTISGSVSDIAGNSSPISGSFNVGDNVAPTVSDVSPAGAILDTSPTISAAYNDSGATPSGIDQSSVTVSLDGAPMSGCTVTADGVSCPASGLAYGDHAISGSVSDNAGNTSAISGSFVVGDNDAPFVSDVSPSGTINTPDTDIAASYGDALSGIDTASVSVTLDGAPMSGCTVTGAGVTCPATGLAYGDHTIGGSVSDVAGNSSPINGSFSIVESIPPVVSNVLPAGTIYTPATTISADYTDAGTPSSGIDTSSVSVTLNGSPLSGCTVTAAGVSCDVSGLAFGDYTIGGSVSDNAGNSSAISGTFSVGDNTAPTVTSITPYDTIYTTSVMVSANYNDSGPTTSGIDTSSVSLSLDGNPLSGCTVTAASISCAVSGLSYGNHTITGSVSDNSGNVTPINRSFFVGDNVAPTVSGISPSGQVPSSNTVISASYSDSLSGIDTASVSMSLDGTALSGCTITGSGMSCPVTGLSYGPHSFSGSVSDIAGNSSAINGSFSVVESGAPVVSNVQPNTTVFTATTTISADYVDTGSPQSGINRSSVVVKLDGNTVNGCVVTATNVSCSVGSLTYGSHAISGSVADNAGNTTPISGSFDVGDNTAPTVSNVKPWGTVYLTSQTVSANFNDFGPVVSGINPASANIVLDGATLSGCSVNASGISCPVSGLTVGDHIITGSVADNDGNTSPISGSFTLSTDSVPPTVQGVQPSGNITTTASMIVVSYSDPTPGSGIDVNAVNVMLDGVSLTGCSVSGSGATCPASEMALGPHSITGSVSDIVGNTTPFSGSFTVVPPPESSSSPHGGYGTSNAPVGSRTDLCLTCHDIHQAEGDYALMREATVTETCGTCHALFGIAANGTWTEAPINLPDGNNEATVSSSAAYENVGTDRVSGHRLGRSLDPGTPDRVSDEIPGSDLTLRIMESDEYEEGDLYNGEPATSKSATNGLYCASCHTPHGSVGGVDTDGNGQANEPIPVNDYNISGMVTSQAFYGDQLVIDDCAGLAIPSEECSARFPNHVNAEKLISSNPNHMKTRSMKTEDANGNGVLDAGEDTIIVNGTLDSFLTVDSPSSSYNNWCLECHNKQWTGDAWAGQEMHGTGGYNHPPLCVSCHGPGNAGMSDFPHTSGNVNLLTQDHDGICLGCHELGALP